jgi:hypothetical protein
VQSPSIPADEAWVRLAEVRAVLRAQPELARAVRRLTLADQLELTFELFTEDIGETELPSNVIPFRPRRPR